MPRRKDIWRCGIVRKSISEILVTDAAIEPVRWFDEEPEFTFLADPFGWQAKDVLHVFVEHYDYRSRYGHIERLTFDRNLKLLERRPVLSEPWHLSYPFIFEGEGAVWMLPEAHRSGKLTLYRAHSDLADWRAECVIELDCVPVDASICRYQDRWWLFYSPATSKATKLGHLHIAWADKLTGLWTPHPGNPVRIARSSARPGGTPSKIDDRLMLPVQDCSRTYGGAIRLLWIDRLDESDFAAMTGEPLTLPSSAGSYAEGMHTLSACGDYTLIDVKSVDRSLRGMMLDIRRRLGGFSS